MTRLDHEAVVASAVMELQELAMQVQSGRVRSVLTIAFLENHQEINVSGKAHPEMILRALALALADLSLEFIKMAEERGDIDRALRIGRLTESILNLEHVRAEKKAEKEAEAAASAAPVEAS